MIGDFRATERSPAPRTARNIRLRSRFRRPKCQPPSPRQPAGTSCPASLRTGTASLTRSNSRISAGLPGDERAKAATTDIGENMRAAAFRSMAPDGTTSVQDPVLAMEPGQRRGEDAVQPGLPVIQGEPPRPRCPRRHARSAGAEPLRGGRDHRGTAGFRPAHRSCGPSARASISQVTPTLPRRGPRGRRTWPRWSPARGSSAPGRGPPSARYREPAPRSAAGRGGHCRGAPGRPGSPPPCGPARHCRRAGCRAPCPAPAGAAAGRRGRRDVRRVAQGLRGESPGPSPGVLQPVA